MKERITDLRPFLGAHHLHIVAKWAGAGSGLLLPWASFSFSKPQTTSRIPFKSKTGVTLLADSKGRNDDRIRIWPGDSEMQELEVRALAVQTLPRPPEGGDAAIVVPLLSSFSSFGEFSAFAPRQGVPELVYLVAVGLVDAVVVASIVSRVVVVVVVVVVVEGRSSCSCSCSCYCSCCCCCCRYRYCCCRCHCPGMGKIANC